MCPFYEFCAVGIVMNLIARMQGKTEDYKKTYCHNLENCKNCIHYQARKDDGNA